MDTPETFFPSEKLARLFFLKEFKPSVERKMVKVLTFINLFPPLLAILTKTRNKMTMAIAFSLQNDAIHKRSIHNLYSENIALVLD